MASKKAPGSVAKKRAGRSAEADGKALVEDYLSRVPEPARGTLEKMREVIRRAAPAEATEGIGYGMPVVRWGRPLMGFAAFADHCGLFPMSATVLPGFREELRKYEVSKGGIRFRAEKPLPASLVRRLVKARMAEIEGVTRTKD
jgi:uncharacterized protein YdhG (YjbR/CyaY superfamily)